MLDKSKRRFVRTALVVAGLFVVADNVYKTVEGISYLEREKCIVNKLLPEVGFILFEYFVELGIVVFLGVFLATVLEKLFVRHARFFPSNPLTAFLYASVLPVCACTAIPLVRTMQAQMKLRTIVTFIVAAPLLNPYIVVLSFSVLGVTYGVLRIACSAALAISAGFVVEAFQRGRAAISPSALRECLTDECTVGIDDLYLKTWAIFRSVLPYLLVGGAIGAGLEILLPKSTALSDLVDNSPLSTIALVLAGVPFYFCNGTDVLLLRPLVCSGILEGTAIAFSLTSTAICITSIFMLLKFMGRRLTFVLIGHVVVVTFLMSQGINLALGDGSP